jgi:peptidyl-tRNA hydrolase
LKEFDLAVEVIDLGRTEVVPGTRTVVVLPVMPKDQAPNWIKELPLL